MKKFLFVSILFFVVNSNLYSLKKSFGPWDTKLVKVERNKKNNKQIVINTPKWGFTRFIRFFQIYISPQDGPNCRYRPTCSQYALLSIKKYGPILGIIMGADRFLRCNPLGAWGRDEPEDNYFFNTKDKK